MLSRFFQNGYGSEEEEDSQMFGMSQEVGWDESQYGVDLRLLAAKSPKVATPGSSASSSSSTTPLDDVKRRLERGSNNDDGTSPASSGLHTQPASTVKKLNNDGNDQQNEPYDDEIERIFSVLNREKEEKMAEAAISPAAEITQRTSNTSSSMAKANNDNTMPPPNTAENKTSRGSSSLASRFQRRRKISTELESKSKRRRRRRLQLDNNHTFRMRNGSRPTAPTFLTKLKKVEKVDAGGGNGNEFDAVLQKMAKVEEKSKSQPLTNRIPLRPVDKNFLNRGTTGSSEIGQAPAKAGLGDSTMQKQQNSGLHVFPPDARVTSRSEKSSHGTTDGPQMACQPTKPGNQYMRKAPPPASSKEQNVIPPPRQVTLASSTEDDDFGDWPDFDDDAAAQLDILCSMTSSQQALPPHFSKHNTKTAAPAPSAETTAVLRNQSNNVQSYGDVNEGTTLGRAAPHPNPFYTKIPPLQAASTSNQVTRKNPNSSHGFIGNKKPVQMGQKKWIPSSGPPLQAAISKTVSMQNSANPPSEQYGPRPIVQANPIDHSKVNPQCKQFSVMTTHTSTIAPSLGNITSDKALTPKPTANPKNEINVESSPSDDFGDFPDMDFDALDKNIETRYTQMSQNPAAPIPTRAQTNRRSNFGPLIYPAYAQVKNPKANNLNQGLAFAAFSRYKVLEIFIDNKTFTKRITVSVWTDSMLVDQEKERNIHRNIQVTTPETCSTPSLHGCHATTNTKYNPDGYLHLRGEWFHTQLSPGEVIHVCSLSGQYRTDPDALPIILHTSPPDGSDIDDLVLIVHPDILMTPTTVSDTVGCSRQAVLKSRIGSTGFSKAALVGTMRHSLFETCIKEQNFDRPYVHRMVQKIVRKNAEALLSCSMSTEEAEGEVLAILPTIEGFLSEYTDFGRGPKSTAAELKPVEGHSRESDIRLIAHSAHSVEEPLISHELALKGNVDAILETTTQAGATKYSSPINMKKSLMSLELKTGHNQKTQNAHLAQVSLYILLLQISYGMGSERGNRAVAREAYSVSPDGASAGAMLLYLNHNAARAVHVSPLLGEIKSLIGQRNVAATGVVQSSRPRGIALLYDEDNTGNQTETKRIHLYPAPPAQLPLVRADRKMCERCFVNTECMLYAATENKFTGPNRSSRSSHKELFERYTGHLLDDDIAFFRDWDRLIDLEADASNQSVALNWLSKSRDLEAEKGETMSSLVYEGPEPIGDGGAILVFRRWGGDASQISGPLDGLSFSCGDQVVIGTDSTSFDAQLTNHRHTSQSKGRKMFRHRMHLVRGKVHRLLRDKINISGSREDLERIRDMVQRYRKESQDETIPALLFRVDKDKSSFGIGTLRQNMINFMTADSPSRTGETDLSTIALLKQKRLPRLRDIVIRLKEPSQVKKQPRSALFQRRDLHIPGCSMNGLWNEFNHELNSDQQNAVEKVFNQTDFSIVQGLPGTGKTSTLSFIVRLLAAHGKRVLVTSYTHSAVDNVVLKLMEKDVRPRPEIPSPVVRIAKKSSCHEEVHSVLASVLASNLENVLLSQSSKGADGGRQSSASSESLKRVVSNAQIVCCTALSVPRSPLLTDEKFDVVIIDEAGQISLPAILGALMSADSFVLFGDHLQLPPLVTSEIAQHGGFGISLMRRLAENHPDSISRLTYQYRMNSDICRLSSRLIYGGMLKCGTPEVSKQILDLPQYPEGAPNKVSGFHFDWLRTAIKPSRPALFVDTDNIRKDPRPFSQRKIRNEHDGIEELETKVGGKVGGKVVNPTEATVVRYLALGLISAGLNPASIGVLSPFRSQLDVIGTDPAIVSLKQQGLELSTIDRYQGRDKPVIILSLVRSNKGGKAGRLLQDIRRLNVALTRAKKKLLIIGSFSTLKKGSEPLNDLLQDMERLQHRVLLPEDALQCYEL